MYEEKWVLATIKRNLVAMKNKSESHYSTEYLAAEMMLEMIAETEADAILGTPIIVEEEVNKLLDSGCNEEGCAVFPESEVK